MMLSARFAPTKAAVPLAGSCRSAVRRGVAAQASKNDTTDQIQERTERVVADLKDKWEKTEEKPAFVGLAAASFVAIYVLNGVVDALEGVPLVSGLFKLVGIFVSSWFVYRYLVFAPDREELQGNIRTFIKKVQGKA